MEMGCGWELTLVQAQSIKSKCCPAPRRLGVDMERVHAGLMRHEPPSESVRQ